MEFENGATGSFVTCTADSPGINRFEILGSKGKIVCEKDELTVNRLFCDLQEFLQSAQNGFAEPEYTTEIIKQSGSKSAARRNFEQLRKRRFGLRAFACGRQRGIKVRGAFERNAAFVVARSNGELALG